MIVPILLNFQKIKKELGDSLVPKILQGENILGTVLSTIKKNDLGQFEKSQQVYLSEKEGEAISAIRSTVIQDAENLGFVPIYEAKSGN